MPLIVVATFDPKPGRTQEVLDAFTQVVPLVHAEPGCELYAVHTDGNAVVMVERWSSKADLDAHAAGDALKKFGELLGDALTRPADVWATENVPMGDPAKGTIQ